MWTQAARNGLYLSLITIVIELIKVLFLDTSNITLNYIAILFKTFGSIYLLYYFMKSYRADKDYVSYSESFKYGMATSFMSSLVCAVFIVLIYTIIAPQIAEGIVLNLLESYETMGISVPGMDYDNLMKMVPVTLTIAQIFNCNIFGLLFSSILAKYTKKEI